ncbi:MAG: DUF4037 domain-containing protein [Acutalibacter sp.]|jgi:hypothetical protein
MPEFIKGRELCRGFFHQIAKPILDRDFPGLVYTAGLLGYGSDVLGYDDAVSTDHMWGPRFYLFLREEDLAWKPRILEAFSAEFPPFYRGYSVNFSPPDPNDNGIRHAEPSKEGKVDPLVFLYTPEEYLGFYLGASSFDSLSDLQWLSLSENRLLALSKAEFYVDGLNLKKRLEPLRYYPRSVWLYLIASNWSLIAEEQAFVKRCASVGDDTGSILVCARIAERLMRLGFLYCRQYAPYSKWFGTAFQQLPLPPEIGEAISRALKAPSIAQREEQIVLAQQQMARLHNSLSITPPVSEEIQSYFGRDIQVIWADRIAQEVQALLKGTPLAQAPLIGTFSEVANFTTLYENVSKRPAMEAIYRK